MFYIEQNIYVLAHRNTTYSVKETADRTIEEADLPCMANCSICKIVKIELRPLLAARNTKE